MKKIFLGLLIAAAAAGTYFILQNKKTSVKHAVQKELLTGTWKPESLTRLAIDTSEMPGDNSASIDTGFMQYLYDVRANGQLFLHNIDSTSDSAWYQWDKTNRLLVKQAPADSTASIFDVISLTVDSLVLRSKDSLELFFTKVKN